LGRSSPATAAVGIQLIHEKRKRSEYAQQLKEAQIESGLRTNYETMIERTNQAALGYRARALLELRLPARQALMS